MISPKALSSHEPWPLVGMSSRRVQLRPYRPDDLPSLYGWHTDLRHLHFWIQDREILPYERFVSRFERRMKNRMDQFFMVEHKGNKQSIGFVYNYGSDSVDRVSFVTLFVDQQFKARGYGIDVGLLFLNHLFANLAFRKIYAEMYSYNSMMVSIVEKAGCVREGCLQERRYWNGTYWDEYIYGMTADLFQQTLNRYLPYLVSVKKM